MILLILLALVLLFLSFLLFTPLVLCIDSKGERFFIQMKGLFKASLVPSEKVIPDLKFRVFFFNFRVDPTKFKGKVSTPKQKRKKRKKARKRRRVAGVPNRALNLLRSFRVKRFELDLDTGDHSLNAYLYPVFFFLNSEKRTLSVNYHDRNELVLVIENRLIRMLYAFFR